MASIKAQLAEKKIYNEWSMVDGSKEPHFVSFVAYSRQTMGSPGWKLRTTNKKYEGHWAMAGSLPLAYNFSELNEALKKASEVTGVKQWVRSPFGGYIPLSQALRHGMKPKKILGNI